MKAYEYFPENKLSANLDLALCVRRMLIMDSDARQNEDLSSEQVSQLHQIMMSDLESRLLISKYFCLFEFEYANGIFSKVLADYAKLNLETAKKYDASSTRIEKGDIVKLESTLKAQLKVLRNKVKDINTQRIEDEKIKIIKPIRVTSSDLTFVASVFTTLFVLSGFLYSKLFFNYFGVAVGDFFSVSDYLASSVDVILYAFTATAVGVISYFIGVSSALTNHLHSQQFEIVAPKKSSRFILPFFFFFSLAGLFIDYYQSKPLRFVLLYIPLAIAFFHFFHSSNLWKYIENRFQVGFLIIVFFTFFLNLGISLASKIQSLVIGTFSAPYIVKFKDSSVSYPGYEFVSSNSQYVFLWNKENANMLVVSKSDVSEFISN
jgi:hypothetical protein